MQQALPWLVCVLVGATALAGCASDDDSGPQDVQVDGTGSASAAPSSSPPAQSSAPAASSGAPAPSATNTAPTAMLGTDVAEAAVPVDVEFTVEASDDDGDALTWTLDVDSDGAAETEGTGADLPFTYTHSFTEAGTYTATLTVSDGTDEATATAEFVLTEATGGDDAPEPVVITGDALVPNPAHSQICAGDGIDGSMHDLAPAEGGWDWTLDNSAFFVYWWDDGGFMEGGGNSGGTVPEGATRIEVCSETAVAASYTVTLTAP